MRATWLVPFFLLPTLVGQTSTPAFGRLPLRFVVNAGQWPTTAHFVARRGNWLARAEPDALVLQLSARDAAGRDRGVALWLAFAGTAQDVDPVGESPQPGTHSYFLGRDPAGWRTGVPGYGSLLYRGLWEGVDLRVRGSDAHELEYDLLLRPGADLTQVEVQVRGASGMRIEADGALVIDTEVGPVRQPLPCTWEVGASGRRIPVACGYVQRGADRYGFAAEARDPNRPLVVDPKLIFASYLGSSGLEDPQAGLHVDGQGNTTLAGYTTSPGFPTTAGAYDTTQNGGHDIFVTRMNATGTALVWSTFIGGSRIDAPNAMEVDASGAVVLTGYTTSTDLPTLATAYDRTANGSYDSFGIRLAPGGNALLGASYLGGTANDQGYGVAIGSFGVAMTGFTDSSDFPTTAGAYQTTHQGGRDTFVAVMDAGFTKLLASTYLGGSKYERPTGGLALGGAGNSITVAGYTTSTNYPVTSNALRRTNSGGDDGFVARFNSGLSQLLSSTYLGSTGQDRVLALNVPNAASIVVSGSTPGPGFPLGSRGYDLTANGGLDVFVLQLSFSLNSITASTLLGGSGDEWPTKVVALPSGVFVSGFTKSNDFPTTPGAFQRTFGAGMDGFVAQLNPTAEALWGSTYIGGTTQNNTNGWDTADGLAVSGNDTVTVGGYAASLDFPVTRGAFQGTHGGSYNDGWVARLPMSFAGARRYGTATPSCLGWPTFFVLDEPRAGSRTFGLACTKAPPSTAGLFGLAAAGLQTGIPVLGITLWLNPAPLLLTFPAVSDASGSATLPVPLPAGTTGARFFGQFIWQNTASCGGTGTFSASDAFEVTVQ